MMEAISIIETQVKVYQTTQRNIPLLKSTILSDAEAVSSISYAHNLTFILMLSSSHLDLASGNFGKFFYNPFYHT